MKLERDGLSIEDGDEGITIGRGPRAADPHVTLTPEDLLWLVVTAGPAVLHERHPHREAHDRNQRR